MLDHITTKMRYIGNLASKLIIEIKRLRKRIISIGKDFFAIIGFLLMIAEALVNIWNYNGIYEIYKNKFLWII